MKANRENIMRIQRPMKWLAAAALTLGFAAINVQTVDAASKAAEAKKAIADLAAAKDAKSKAAALDEIGKIAQVQKALAEPALADIKKLTDDASPIVRKAAAQAYGRCDPDAKEGVPFLTRILKNDKDEDVKMGAASGLAAMGPKAKDALPVLREMQKEERAKSKDGKQTRLSRELANTSRAIAEIKKN
jgi:HEAT repeat protein